MRYAIWYDYVKNVTDILEMPPTDIDKIFEPQTIYYDPDDPLQSKIMAILETIEPIPLDVAKYFGLEMIFQFISDYSEKTGVFSEKQE